MTRSVDSAAVPRYRRFVRRHIPRARSAVALVLAVVASVVAVRGVSAIYPPLGAILSAVILFAAALAIDNDDAD